MLFWQYFSAIIIISAGYPLGQCIGKIAQDEIKAGSKYLLIFRDTLLLASIAVAAYAHNQTVLQYALPVAIIISYFWIWKYYEKIYNYIIPIILFFSIITDETFIINSVLLFLSTFTTGSLAYKQLKKPRDYLKYWPVPSIGIILTIVLIFL